MKKYYNYSPEIPSGDDLQDDIPEIGPQQEEQVEKPRRRRRPSAAAQRPAAQQAAHAEPAPAKAPAAPQKPFMESVSDWFHSTGTRMVAGIILGGMALWLGIAFFSYFGNCIADQSVVESLPAGAADGIGNDAGEGGARRTEFLINKGFGVGSFVIVVWLLCLSMKLLVGYPRFRTLDFTIKSLIAFITLSVVVGMLSIGLDTDVNWGGLHGRIINEKVYEFIGWTGAIILSVVLIAIFVVICLRDFIKWIMRKKHAYDERRRREREELEAIRLKEEEVRATERRELEDEARSGE
ncbi:MAG: DNA translocase FtsK 4TM domain-containing protein, partial [Muribaculaceae bacterium]|nr:DNA translocase FtsK 4TM domain-containing protein [Muribaculaceae bacterium]